MGKWHIDCNGNLWQLGRYRSTLYGRAIDYPIEMW